MVLDMGPMLRGEINRMPFEFHLKPELPSDVKASDDIAVNGLITDKAGYMHLTLEAALPFTAQCARCLDDISDVFRISLERTVAAEGTLTEEQLEENVDEYAVIENGKLDLDALVQEELLLSFPMRFLCSEDCPGLCPKCGKPRRLGDCGCSAKEIDPRLAILKTLLENGDETN